MARGPINISDVDASVDKWTSDATEVSKIRTEQNIATQKFAQFEKTWRNNNAEVNRELEQFTKDSVQSLSRLQEQLLRKTQQFTQQAEQEVGQLKETMQPLTAAHEALREEIMRHDLTKNNSLLANPITYIRDQWKSNQLQTRYNDIVRNLNRFDQAKDQVYMEHARKIKQWREQEFAIDYLAVRTEIQINKTSLDFKQQRINDELKSSQRLQQLNQQRQVDAQGALEKKSETAFTGFSQYLYFLANGHTDGWNPDVYIPQAKMFWDSQTQESRDNFMRGMIYWQKGMDAGIPLTRAEFITGLATQQGLKALRFVADISPDPKLRNALAAIENTASRDFLNKKFEAWRANPENLKLDGTPMDVPAALQKQWLQEAEDYVRDLDVSVVDFIQAEGRNIGEFGSRLPATVFNSTANPELMEAFDQSPAVIQFYQNKDTQAEIGIKAQQTAAEYGSEQVALAAETIKAMLKEGIPDNEIAEAIAVQFRENTVANYRRSPMGESVDSLLHVGVTYGATGVTDTDKFNVPVKAKFHYSRGADPTRTSTLPPLAGERTGIFGRIMTKEIDLANTADITQLVERVRLQETKRAKVEAEQQRIQESDRRLQSAFDYRVGPPKP